MDDSISLKNDSENFNTEFNLFFTLESCSFPSAVKHKNTVIKYTKLPNFESEAKDVKKSAAPKTSSRFVGADCVDPKLVKQDLLSTDSRIKRTKKYSEELRQQLAKNRDLSKGNESVKVNVNKSKQFDKKNIKFDNDKTRLIKEKDIQSKNKNINKYSKNSLSKNIIISVENEKEALSIKQTLYDELQKGNNTENKNNLKKFQHQQNKLQPASSVNISKKQPTSTPYIEKIQKPYRKQELLIDQTVKVREKNPSKHVSVETDPQPIRIDQITQIDSNFDSLLVRMEDKITEMDVTNEKFDSLCIPDVTLTKEIKDSTTNEVVNLYNTSLPNLKTPSTDIFAIKSDKNFQKELNFIDSFFESLNYLEKLSEKYFNDINTNLTNNKQFEVNDSDYLCDLTKIADSSNVDDSETMASKSLCQLNLLIHNEQRRARDFLFVLKMQEDVLKDYIKSQMLWLEKKKKQDNIDISALKKKQRGALLKLQHECGEMQRMRKALLTLSEKRKVALMKTKKNIEMKLTNNVDVKQIILGKKKLKRNTSSDRSLAPLKCFDLSSSGCEDSTTSKEQLECAWYTTLMTDNHLDVKSVTSAEKSIQTGDSIIAAELPAQLIATTAENCIAVDGGYLNILFHNLSLPQIFSNGKQYEVNEEALKNIVNSSNSHNNLSKDSEAFDKFMEQIKNPDSDGSSSVSTAHSLVEEFNHYYKCLGDEENSLGNSPEYDNDSVHNECEVQSSSEPNSDVCDHSSVTMITMDSDESLLKRLSNVYGLDSTYKCEPAMLSVEIQTNSKEIVGVSVAGPLPVPAGAAAPVDDPPDTPVWSSNISVEKESASSDQVFSSNMTSTSEYASPVLCEAEELRRQQLAIEREIKALEQQQCQLLVVREIPDKPPPPYIPPSEVRMPKPPKMFLPDNVSEDKIQNCMDTRNELLDINDPFDVFFKDFCDESVERQRIERSDKPWDACNLLPQKPKPDTKKIVNKTCTEMKEVLSGTTPSFVSGISSRRTDHIDDILFAEWRRCEPEWTSLHTEEASVKNQLFESIFNKLVNETVDEYKKIVCTDSKEKK
ncbi:Centrosome-associated protein 350 [Papilio machaon]|uniref:Centrosome-associated protein 350 n=1 Tax=Papilio machaon TaxID=76193 RepID=A0A194QN12_PAPMA|nr:Centrosome-associated protein 350 [Papilio machaon]